MTRKLQADELLINGKVYRRVWGAFDDEDEAKDHAKRIRDRAEHTAQAIYIKGQWCVYMKSL